MAFLKVYIHFVWTTKNRNPFLYTPAIRSNMWNHIKENSIKKAIHIDTINGYAEHCHCLISLGVDQTMGQIMQLIKGESSFWFNRQGLIREKFSWQDQFYAVSVCPDRLAVVRNYIENQENHHNSKESLKYLSAYIIEQGFSEFEDNC